VSRCSATATSPSIARCDLRGFTNRSTCAKKCAWKRSSCTPGDYADSYALRAGISPELFLTGRQLAKAESEHSDQTGSTDLEPYLATDHLFVPSNGDLDKSLRYEVMINKQLNHAIAQLDRLQAPRKAASVPGLIRLKMEPLGRPPSPNRSPSAWRQTWSA
jgi:hypothetical protein